MEKGVLVYNPAREVSTEKVRRTIGKKISVEEFRSVRTVGDLVTVMQRLLQDP